MTTAREIAGPPVLLTTAELTSVGLRNTMLGSLMASVIRWSKAGQNVSYTGGIPLWASSLVRRGKAGSWRSGSGAGCKTKTGASAGILTVLHKAMPGLDPNRCSRGGFSHAAIG